MNTPETVALLKLSRDEYVRDAGVSRTAKPLEAGTGTGAGTRTTPRVRVGGLRRWLLGLVTS